jgi:quercetin dioxygenase-like cupin family protein
MTKLLTSFCTFCAVIAAGVAVAVTMMSPTVVPAGSAKWMPVSGFPGVMEAVLYGTPSKAGSGVFTERYKASSDVTFPVHTHPTDELVTVLSGTFVIGFGDKVNWSEAKALTAGGYVGIPAGVHHYGMMKSGAIIEVSGIAPDTMNIVKLTKTSM